eukprot:jgi/Botrbrau1/15714/Bobra.4_1s0085.2
MFVMFLLSNDGPIMRGKEQPEDKQDKSPPKRSSIDINRAADNLGIVKMTREESWEEAFCSKFPSSVCGGFSGNWWFYTPDGDVTDDIRCIRTYQVFKETEPGTVILRNFYATEPAGRKATRRDIDGVFETYFARSLSEPYFSCSTRIFPTEEREGLPQCSFWRAIPVEKDVLLRVALKLPPKPGQGLSDMHMRFPGWSPNVIASAKWAMEGFLEDGENRWSMGPLYSVQSLRLRSHFAIKEHKTVVDPNQPIDFASQPQRSERPRLDENPKTWFPSSWEGRMREIVWDSDGDMLQLRSRPASWEPPDSQNKAYRWPPAFFLPFPLDKCGA